MQGWFLLYCKYLWQSKRKNATNYTAVQTPALQNRSSHALALPIAINHSNGGSKESALLNLSLLRLQSFLYLCGSYTNSSVLLPPNCYNSSTGGGTLNFFIGRRKPNVVPSSLIDSNTILPPCAVMTFFAK